MLLQRAWSGTSSRDPLFPADRLLFFFFFQRFSVGVLLEEGLSRGVGSEEEIVPEFPGSSSQDDIMHGVVGALAGCGGMQQGAEATPACPAGRVQAGVQSQEENWMQGDPPLILLPDFACSL